MSYKQIVFEPLKELGTIEVYDGYVPGVRSKAQEALKVTKKAALDWFGDDQMFHL